MDAETTEPKPKPGPAENVGDLTLYDRSGLVDPRQEKRVKSLIVQWVDSGQLPRQFQVKLWGDPKRQVTREAAQLRTWYAVQALSAVRAHVLTNLRFVAYIEGQTMFFGDLPLSLVQRDKMLAEPPDEFWLDRNYKPINRHNKNTDARPFLAVSRMRFAGGDMGWREREYSLQDARDNNKYWRDNEGQLLLKANDSRLETWLKSPWAMHTRRMLQMRARSWLIKDMAPQSLNGVPQAEYDAQDVPAEIMDTRNVPSNARQADTGAPVDARSDDELFATSHRGKSSSLLSPTRGSQKVEAC